MLNMLVICGVNAENNPFPSETFVLICHATSDGVSVGESRIEGLVNRYRAVNI